MNTVYFGIIEDRDDPLKLGRCRVRVAGMHTHNNQVLPVQDLPWALVVQPVNGTSIAANNPPAEGTEVLVVYADEPHCQIPVVVGCIPTLSQSKFVWVDQIPEVPKVRDILSPDIGHSLPKSAAEQSRNQSTEIRTQQTASDKVVAYDIMNNASNSKEKSLMAIGGVDGVPTTVGQSSVAMTVRNSYGQSNPTPNQKFVKSQIELGSTTKAIQVQVLSLIKQSGSQLAGDIALGKTTISEAAQQLKTDMTNGVIALGQQRFEAAVGSILGNGLGTSLGSINTGLEGIAGALQGGLSFDSLQQGLDAVGNVVNGIAGLGSGLSSLIGGEQGLNGIVSSITEGDLFNTIGDSLSSVASNAADFIENFDTDKLLSIGSDLTSSAPQFVQSAVGSVITNLSNYGFDQETIKEIVNSFKGAGGSSFAVTFSAAGMTDTITRKLRELLATGMDPFVVVDGVMEKLITYSESMEKALNKVAAAGVVTGIDGSVISTSVRNTVRGWQAVLQKMMTMVYNAGTDVIEWVVEQFNTIASIALDIFNGAAGIIKSLLEMIPFSNIIVNVVMNLVATLIPGFNENDFDCGIGPFAVGVSIDKGTYNSNAFNGLGNRKVIDEKGKGKLTQSAFANVGEGNTPPVHGVWGGPNFGGSVSKPVQAKVISPSNNPSNATRTLNATIPDLSSIGYAISNPEKTSSNLFIIANGLTSVGIATLEAQAAFLAVSFAYCQLIPKIADYEYTEKEHLIAKFPRTFGRATDKIISDHLFARSMHKCTEAQFYNFVYDSATDGQSLGNVASTDGYKYAEAGLLPLVGANSYKAYGLTSASKFITNMSQCLNVASQQFLKAIQNIPAGNISGPILTALSIFNVDNTVAIKAFEHFYGAPLFDSFQTTNKTAGTNINRNSYYGSAQENTQSCGFTDPNGKYPYNRNSESSSISKLAQGNGVNTVVASKESNRKLGVPIANDQGTWDQPHSGYNAQYPYNAVKETESGHIEEFDDTPGYERIHRYHRSGTFEEIVSNGTKIIRIVGDGYEIIDRNGFISIAGNANVTAVGNINIYCQSDVNIEADGTVEVKSHGNMNIGVANDLNISAGGNINMWSGKSINNQCAENMHIRSSTGSVYATAKQDFSVVADKDIFVSSNENMYIHAQDDIAIESEEGNGDFVCKNAINVSALESSLQLYSGSNAALSGVLDVDINAGMNLRQQCLLNFTILSTGFARIQSTAMDVSSLGYLHISSVGEMSASATGAVTVSATGALQLGATGLVNVNAGAALTMGAKGAIGITSGGAFGVQAAATASILSAGVVAFDGTLLALNSGMSVPPVPSIPVVAIPALPSGFASKASIGRGAPIGQKAVLYGMATLAPRTPIYPNIPVLTIENPIIRTEPIIEDLDQLEGVDGQLIEKTVAMQSGRPTQIKGPTANDIVDPNISHTDSQYGLILQNRTEFNPNDQISDHFNLGDMFDGGFNKRHILQDQAGLTKQQIVVNLCNTAENVLEQLLTVLPGGISGYNKLWRINSGYRMTMTNNNLVGASKTSQHTKGQAIDIQLIEGTKADHYNLIQRVAANCRFDQLILEYSSTGRSSWIHCSYDANKARRQCLTINLCNKETSQGFVLYA